MNISAVLIPIFSLFLLQFQIAGAQDINNETINAWVELGSMKFFPTKHESGAGVNVTFKCQMNRTLASLHYHNYIDRELAHGGIELFTDRNHYNAGNLMLGITNKKCRYGHVSVSSGLGVFWGEIENTTSYRFTTIGWPIEAAASLNIFPFVGLNLKLFTNINSKHSLIGFGMDIQIGKLREINLFGMKI